MRKEEIALELYNSAKENGFLDTIYEVIGPKVSVSIAFTKKACETSIDDIEFSVRANNALKRAGYFKIDDIVHQKTRDHDGNRCQPRADR